MIKIFSIALLILITAYLLLAGKERFKEESIPIFLKDDAVTNNHQTKITIKVASAIKPDSFLLKNFQKDYSHIWAHLNHLYTSNDVTAGKEYYTEDWFKEICANYKQPVNLGIQRQDISHQVTIKTWSDDDLICTVIDSNAVFSYTFPDGKILTTKNDVAMALHYQGDHWRIDAIKLLNEKPLNK